MTALRGIYQALGSTNVVTYIQSGNVIFSAAIDANTLANRLRHAIQEKWGYTVSVLVREASCFSKIVANNPFKGFDPRTLYVTLLGDASHASYLANTAAEVWGEDRFIAKEDVVYVHCPNGYGKTKLNNSFFEMKGHTWATTRNWKTICKLVELAGAYASM